MRPPRPRWKKASSPAVAWRCCAREKALDKLKLKATKQLGVKHHPQGLEYPLRAIAENAGFDGAVVVNRVRRMKGKNDGYNVEKDAYCDLVEAGVVDPAKVVRTALQNAASVAGLLLTTSSLVTEIPSKSPRPRR